ncbi:RdgB/HAM1 family non-canonical purine NTP pyrophosphatase [Candidatus Acidulodesulfobacterium sp. H_13]|uniref:RdgB/HAM1 family non-canonical purine NTP pyrophosphatase n=1 Tax=Candidatus Acidulodesulfobacterium sp. H_13 TaxID=3395470 RepID=UPI003AF89230
MVDILIATGNSHKFREIKSIMGDFAELNIVCLDKSFQIEIVEDGETYEENAKIKTEGYIKFLDENPGLKSELNLSYIVSEDSGLEVDCLNGTPGIFTARYAGENASDTDNINALLNAIKSKKNCMQNRHAKFVCLTCMYDVKKHSFHYFRGELNGLIDKEVSGAKGFGYDPIFFVPEFNKTVAQIDASEKNKISHRSIAFRRLAETIKESGPAYESKTYKRI